MAESKRKKSNAVLMIIFSKFGLVFLAFGKSSVMGCDFLTGNSSVHIFNTLMEM